MLRRLILAIVLSMAFDAALPVEPTRAGFVIEDETDEEAVHLDRRRLERPDRPSPRDAHAVRASLTRAAMAPARHRAWRADRAPSVPAPPPRLALNAADAPASAEDH